jgi:poly-gamma-glutamate capsule biosynthesis protein CapA/YwtB (metallophosphatase superfamily)
MRKTPPKRLLQNNKPFSAPQSAVRLIFGGDVNFDPTVRMMFNLGVFRLRDPIPRRTLSRRIRERLWRKVISRVYSPATVRRMMTTNSPFDEFSMEKPVDSSRLGRKYYYLDTDDITSNLPQTSEKYSYPFAKIGSFLRQKDLVFVNLETPLTVHPRPNGMFASDPQYIKAMKDAGISIVGVANNHVFDAGEIGFLDTLKNLSSAGIPAVGSGEDFEDARRGKLIELRGLKLLFLGYTQFCNGRFASLAQNYPGILPLDRKMMIEDIKRGRQTADFVFVSLHWGFENQPHVHPKQVEIAHLLIDSGADCIIGHHPHVPHGIEIYRSRPIIYSVGNFIFPRFCREWSDNFLAELVLAEDKIHGVFVHPIVGTGKGLLQPELLSGRAADLFLEELQLKSMVFNTSLGIQNGVGFISLS